VRRGGCATRAAGGAPVPLGSRIRLEVELWQIARAWEKPRDQIEREPMTGPAIQVI
jgi:hypothetical protein